MNSKPVSINTPDENKFIMDTLSITAMVSKILEIADFCNSNDPLNPRIPTVYSIMNDLEDKITQNILFHTLSKYFTDNINITHNKSVKTSFFDTKFKKF